MLSIRNLSLVAENGEERKEILKGINIDIDDSKFVVLTGPNGGGKTTLAKVIMGQIKPEGKNPVELKGFFKREV